MCIPCGKTNVKIMSRSKSSTQFSKSGCYGIISVSQTQLVIVGHLLRCAMHQWMQRMEQHQRTGGLENLSEWLEAVN